MNDFDKLVLDYEKASSKPDKQHSMLPTLLSLLELNETHVVVDVGCGNGFFTLPIAQKARHVIGIDNSLEQLSRTTPAPNIEYICADMLTYDYPSCDRISCPFVLNYIQSPDDLISLFTRFHMALREEGRLVSIIDMPTSLVHDYRKFGAIKKVKTSPLKEGTLLEIELYNENSLIVKLNSIYHEKEVLEDCLKNVGFKKISWAEPVVSQEGIDLKGKDYWERYKENCDVAYLVAKK